MKASDIIQQYKNGERNFQGLNLRGANFKGQNLSDADFSYCQIQSTNFSQANLTGANFTGARAGLQKRWVIILLLAALVLIVLSSLFSTLAGHIVTLIFDSKVENQVGGWVGLITLIIFCVISFRKNLGRGLIVFAFALAFAVAVALAFAVAVAGIVALAGAGAVAVAVAFAGAAAVAAAAAAAGVVAFAGAGAVAVAFAGAVGGAFAGAGAVAVALTLFACFIGYRTLKDETRDPWLRKIAVAFAAIGGTSFYSAIVTDADFTGATLKNTNFNQAILTRTCFKDTIKLNLARPGNTLLVNPNVRDLLINLSSGEGQDLTKANLRGANLKEANLQRANLKQADISEASFCYANLSEANLTEVNAVKTDFTEAYLTGVCLENWNIDATTKLDNIDCQYVYLLNNKKERRPSSGDFQSGEFTKLFEEVFDTVDLIFRDGIDWKVFIAAIKDVQVKNEDTLLEIQSIENKGDGVVVVKVKVPPDANKEKIHQDFNEVYQLKLAAMEAEYKALLAEKLAEKDKEKYDEIIRIERENKSEMMEIFKTQASSVDQYYNFYNAEFKGGFAGQDYTGNVKNIIDQILEKDNKDNSKLRSLLQQLLKTIDGENNID